MRILITGGKGMLGRTLFNHWQTNHTCFVADLPEHDLTQPETLEQLFTELQPEVVVHCAAMTQVDLCESQPERAFVINAKLTESLAKACHQHQVRLIAISTDYVFAGADPTPQRETFRPSPRTVYGASKLAGEEAIRQYCPNHIIARVAWLYGSGGPSFVHTMLALAAADPLRSLDVVNDQHGNPTSTTAVAKVLTAMLTRPDLTGTFHLTCEGVTTWYEFAQTIFRLAGYTAINVTPCTSEAFKRPAKRPKWSALSKEKLKAAKLPAMPAWQEALAQFIRQEWPL